MNMLVAELCHRNRKHIASGDLFADNSSVFGRELRADDLDAAQTQFELRYLDAQASGDENAIELAAYRGKAMADAANGIDCGIVWTAPYAVNVGHALKRGDNDIVIEVVNTWANALRGMDEGTPPYSGIWTNARYRMKTPHLIPAGLHGPVILHY